MPIAPTHPLDAPARLQPNVDLLSTPDVVPYCAGVTRCAQLDKSRIMPRPPQSSHVAAFHAIDARADEGADLCTDQQAH